jgi:hypothetical protein
VPRITLSDGAVLMPLVWYRRVRLARRGSSVTLTYDVDAMDRLGGNRPERDKRLSVETRYTFRHGVIERTDRLIPHGPMTVSAVDLEFATFSSGPRRRSPGDAAFDTGEVRTFSARGLGDCVARPVDDDQHHAPSGPLRTSVVCHKGPFDMAAPITMSWRIGYIRG